VTTQVYAKGRNSTPCHAKTNEKIFAKISMCDYVCHGHHSKLMNKIGAELEAYKAELPWTNRDKISHTERTMDTTWHEKF